MESDVHFCVKKRQGSNLEINITGQAKDIILAFVMLFILDYKYDKQNRLLAMFKKIVDLSEDAIKDQSLIDLSEDAILENRKEIN